MLQGSHASGDCWKLTMVGRIPIAVFGYSRALQLQRTLESISACNGFENYPVYLFLDGEKGERDRARVAEVRALAAGLDWPNLTVQAAPTNRGLRRSIISGISQVLETYDAAIVIEDDLRLSPVSLEYFSTGLSAYADDPRVQAICGYSYKFRHPRDDQRAFFLPMSSSWGWATWRRAWQPFEAQAEQIQALGRDHDFLRRFDRQGIIAASTMLKAQEQGLIDSWAILWNAYLNRSGGMALFPAETMVLNAGFGTVGATHAWNGNPINWLLRHINANRKLAMGFTLPTRIGVDDVVRRSTANTWEARLHRVSAHLGYIRRRLVKLRARH